MSGYFTAVEVPFPSIKEMKTLVFVTALVIVSLWDISYNI